MPSPLSPPPTARRCRGTNLSDTRRPQFRFSTSLDAELHVGAARTALFNWLLARKSGGALLVHVTDRAADARDARLAALMENLRWIGIDPDAQAVLTSARTAVYDEYVARLVASDRTASVHGALHLKVPGGTTVVDDAIKGRITFDNAALGDIVLLHADGAPSELFVAALDDALLEITCVVRDDDHLDETPRQLLIHAALDLRSPRYAHVGRVLADAGEALPTIAGLRRSGILPGALRDHLALLGWSPGDTRESFTREELTRAFSLEHVGHAASHFNAARLRAFNARELRALPRPELAALLITAMQRRGLLEDPVPDAARRWIETFLDAYGSEFETLGEALASVADLRAESVMVPALDLEKLRNRQVVFFLDAVGQYVDAQPELRGLPLGHDLPAIAAEFGIAKDDAFGAVRMALTGRHDGAPLTALFPLLGHDRILIRIGAISSHLLHGRGLEPIPYGPGGVPFQTIQPQRPESP